jgi:uncharacterized protein (TIGR03435 family)
MCSAAALGAMLAFAQVPATPKFDVASVKVVDNSRLGRPGGGGRASGGPGTSDPGRFSDPVDTMLGMLMKAFGVESGQILGPAVQPRVGASFYEVMATMPPDTTKPQFQAMFQNLLAERFQLVVHHETRMFPAYELVIDKGGSKLKETAAQPDDGPPTGRRVTTGYVGVGNIEMNGKTTEDLARQLGMALRIGQGIQTQNVNLPIPRVVDKTGLTGRYTFNLEFSQPGPPGFTPAPGSPATDLPDLFVALREKLGLRLNKTQGVPVDVIVVDSLDSVPTAN